MRTQAIAAWILAGMLSASIPVYGGTGTVSAGAAAAIGATAAAALRGTVAVSAEMTAAAATGAAAETEPSGPALDQAVRATDLDLGNGMVFRGEEKKMSLAQARELVMTSSSGIQVAKLNLAASKAKTESYYQLYRKANASYVDPVFGGLMTSSKTEKAMTRLMADFAQAQSENNYQAEINALNAAVVKNYFELQQAVQARTISESNFAVQEAILQATRSKYSLGVVSKQDVLRAEVAFNQAKADLDAARNGEALARMSYNLYFGFNLMQKVELTDSPEIAPISGIPLADAIRQARTNRNEVTGAAFMVAYREMNLTNTGNNYAQSSAQYLQAQAELMEAQKTFREMPATIEMDVRAKYSDMVNAKAQVDLGKLSLDKAAEAYRLARLQFDMGLATLTDVQQAQTGSYAARLQYSQNLLQLKLAVMAYENATTVGTASIPF